MDSRGCSSDHEGSSSGLAGEPGLKPPLDLSHHFSDLTKQRRATAQSESVCRYNGDPYTRDLASGLPHPSLFPFDTLQAQVARPDRCSLDPPVNSIQSKPAAGLASLTDRLATVTLTAGRDASYLTVPEQTPETNMDKKADFTTALQYNSGSGYSPLLQFVRKFTRDRHHPRVPYSGGPEVILTCGSADGFSKTVSMLINQGNDQISGRHKPKVLCESFIPHRVRVALVAMGVELVHVQVDDEGLIAHGSGGLEDTLTQLRKEDSKDGPHPKVLYIQAQAQSTPFGPLSEQRKKDIYHICSTHDIIIIEDDPCWFLQYRSSAADETTSNAFSASSPPRTSGADQQQVVSSPSGTGLIESLAPSLLQIDTDGRVIRVDTFSSAIAPGCQLGYITAQPAFIESLALITEYTTGPPSGFVQSMVMQLILGSDLNYNIPLASLLPKEWRNTPGWGIDGWIRWLAGLRAEYERRMHRACRVLDKHQYQLKLSRPVNDPDEDWRVMSKTRIMTFTWPRGGMFVWAYLHFMQHPLWRFAKDIDTIRPLESLFSTAFRSFCAGEPYCLAIVSGSRFASDQLPTDAPLYFRLSFAAESDDRLEEGFSKFGDALQQFWRVKSVDYMRELVREDCSGSGHVGSHIDGF